MQPLVPRKENVSEQEKNRAQLGHELGQELNRQLKLPENENDLYR